MHWIDGDCVFFLDYGMDYDLIMNELIVDDFLFFNIYICYINS